MSLLLDNLPANHTGAKSKEEDEVKVWSVATQIILPVAALAIFWGRRGLFTRFLLQFDKNCLSVICPSYSKRERLLKWASGRLLPTWSSSAKNTIGEPLQFWKDGSLLCILINSAIPGACNNPQRHWKQPPIHGQALAYKYLGIPPAFTEGELENSILSLKYEKLFIQFLIDIQQAITKMSVQEFKYSSYYVARGMGLAVGEQNRKATFYIYPYSRKSSNKHDIFVTIKGPYNTFSSATIPEKFTLKNTFTTNSIDKKRITYQTRAQKLFFRSFSVDFGALINAKEDNKNYIPLKITKEKDRVKVEYIPNNQGVYEISLIVNGSHLMGSPFWVSIARNTSDICDKFNDKEVKNKKTAKSVHRKVISRIIDFIDEKISYNTLSNDLKRPEIVVIGVEEPIERSSVVEVNSYPPEDYNNNEMFDDHYEHYEEVRSDEAVKSGENSSRFLMKEALTDAPLKMEGNTFEASPICGSHIGVEDVEKVSEFREASKPKDEKIKIVIGEEGLKVSSENVEIRTEVVEAVNEKMFEFQAYSKNDTHHQVPDLVLVEHKFKKKHENNLDRKIVNKITQQELNNAKNTNLCEDVRLVEAKLSIKNDINALSKTEPKKRNTLYKSNSMEIINVISNLKNTNKKNLTRSSVSLYSKNHLHSRYDFEPPSDLKERIEYWESLTNLHLEPNKKFQHCNSLPNLFTTKVSKRSDFDYCKSLDFKSRFSQRRDYWKLLSSQTNSCLSLKNSFDYNYSYKSRSSLPDLFSKCSRNDYFTDFKSSIDFYDSSELANFGDKFKECKDYWERLSLHQVNYDEIYSIDEDEISADFNSVPDLLRKPAFNLREQYKKRKHYWETLSLYGSTETKFYNSYRTCSQDEFGFLDESNEEKDIKKEIDLINVDDVFMEVDVNKIKKVFSLSNNK